MRLIPETAPPQIDVAAGQQIGGNPGNQRLVRLVIPVPEPGPVGRVKIGYGNPPAVQLDRSVGPGHGPEIVHDA
jgi:hypothetical protein